MCIRDRLSRNTVDCFLRYCQTVFERYKGKVKYWMTFNEINLLRGYATLGIHEMNTQKYYQALHHLFIASAKAVQLGPVSYTHLACSNCSCSSE